MTHLLVKPTLRLSRGVAWFDKQIVDGIVNFAGSLTVGARSAGLEGFFDKFAVDGIVNLVANLVYFLGDKGRAIQTGRLRSYLGLLALAVVGLFAGFFYWIRA